VYKWKTNVQIDVYVFSKSHFLTDFNIYLKLNLGYNRCWS